jgi:hypothetical protein
MAAIRRLVLAAGSALALAACQGTGVPARASDELQGILLPLSAYAGARLAGERPGELTSQFLSFAAPAAVAAHGPDLFIADAGLDAIFHLDTTLQALRRVGARRAPMGTRLKALEDGTLYVLDPMARELVRLSRDGRVLERLRDRSLLTGVADFAVERASGRILLVDRGRNRLIAVSPALGASIELALGTPWTIASGPDAFYVVDRSRRRVTRFVPEAGATQVFGETVLKLPGVVAVDRYRRVFVHDAGANAVLVFLNGEHIATLAARELGVASVADFAIAGSELVLAGGNTVRLFRLLAPKGAK